MNKEASKIQEGYYIWRTVEDGKIRKEHAQYNRTVRVWSDSPDPGEDYNCRCWAEPMKKSALKNNCDEVRKNTKTYKIKSKSLVKSLMACFCVYWKLESYKLDMDEMMSMNSFEKTSQNR